jgi:probable biosynthetic protein (TIGR04098 family)
VAERLAGSRRAKKFRRLDYMLANYRKKYRQVVNMPQMALTGLSESWLMKEIGDCHWHMLCEDLGLKSNEIFDEFGNRLYATFVRLKFDSCSSLKDYGENDCLDIEGAIQRLGSSLYFSQIDISCNDKSIKCSLATTFSTRDSETDNTKLTKGVPSGNDDVIINVCEMPKHILDIVKLKKSSIHTIEVSHHTFDLTDDVVFETRYKINPYTDINGVGLLYFAAYPLINDVCELDYFNNKRLSDTHWSLNSATMTRDVFYFANCNIDDIILYRLNSYTMIGKDQIALQSSLYRECDNTLMAKIFTVKQLTN